MLRSESIMPHYIVAARLELDADDELEAHLRVEAALEALGEPGLVAVDQVNEWADGRPSDPEVRGRNLEALGRLGVADLNRVGPEDQVVLVGAALPAGADRPHLWVDAAHPSRHAAVDAIWPDGVNPLPCLLVDLRTADTNLERIDYHPVVGMTIGEDRISLAAAPAAVIELLGLLDD
jgi:hypothetical protein